MINGWTAPGFEDVAAEFERNFADRGDLGAAFAAYRNDELVVDLWGGLAERDTGRMWDRDSLQLIFSGTKGLTAACVLLLVQRGQLSLEDPISRYWPEFRAGRTTVAEALSHQARLAWAEAGYADLLDHDVMAAHLAVQAPSTDPRAGFMYHAITWGWLVDELIRRVDGRTAGRFFADEFAVPLDLEVWIGLPADLHGRATTMVAADGVLVDVPQTSLQRPNPLLVPGAEKIWNSAEYRSAGLAAVGGFATARGMARFYAELLSGSVLTTETVELGRREIRRGIEPTWGSEIAYGAGFELQVAAAHLGPPGDAFGHGGAGGSRHGAWPAQGIAFSYLMNEVRAQPDERASALLSALHHAATSENTPTTRSDRSDATGSGGGRCGF